MSSATATLFKKFKLVDDQEIGRLVEKYLRDYDPALRVLANSHREMEGYLARNDLSPEEKFSLFKSNQQRFSKLKVPPAEVPIAPMFGMNIPLAPALAPPALNAPNPADAQANIALPLNAVPPPPLLNQAAPLAQQLEAIPKPAAATETTAPAAAVKTKSGGKSPPHTRSLTATAAKAKLGSSAKALLGGNSEDGVDTFKDTHEANPSPFSKKYLPDVSDNAIHVQKLDLITSLIYKHPELISNDHQTGELVLNGKTLQGTSFSDMLFSLYEKKGTQNLLGQKDFLKQLANILKAEGGQVKPEQVITKRDLVSEVKGLMTSTSQHGSGFQKRKFPFALH